MTILATKARHRLRLLAYLAGFFLAFASALGAYINSSFIEQFVGAERVGFVYASASLVSLLASWLTLPLIRRHGNRETIILFGLGSAASLAILISFANRPLGLVGLGGFIVCNYLAAINLDVYLETLSDDRSTGTIRGFFLTAVNLAWLASPWLSANLAEAWGYRAAYLMALTALAPFVLIAIFGLRDAVSGRSEHISLRAALARLTKPGEINLRRIMILDFLLNFFYAIMVIYMPLYLHGTILLSWPEIGFAFTIMLAPFVLIQLPLGRLADRYLGEKELLIFGLIVMVLACILVPLVRISAVLVWAGVLLLSRVGAATVEVMKETYLFKYLDARDANLVFLFRNMYPLSYLIAPLTASLFLLYFPLGSLFSFLAAVVLLGLPIAVKLKDTR